MARNYESLTNVEWYCFRGVTGVLAEEVKRPWRLYGREFSIEELTSPSATEACFPFESQEQLQEHYNQVTNSALIVVAISVSKSMSGHACMRAQLFEQSEQTASSTSIQSCRLPLEDNERFHEADSLDIPTLHNCSAMPFVVPGDVEHHRITSGSVSGSAIEGMPRSLSPSSFLGSLLDAISRVHNMESTNSVVDVVALSFASPSWTFSQACLSMPNDSSESIRIDSLYLVGTTPSSPRGVAGSAVRDPIRSVKKISSAGMSDADRLPTQEHEVKRLH